MKTLLISATALAGMLATPAFATDVRIENFVGQITIVDGAPSIDVIRTGGDLTTAEGEPFLIDGGYDRPEKTKVCDYNSVISITINRRNRTAERRLKDYPKIEVSVPEGSTLEIENSIILLDTSDVALSSASLELQGCFDAAVGDILEASIAKSGSGNFEAGRVGTLKLAKSGSGNVTIDETGELSFSQSGSGDLDINRIGRMASISKSGSGDVEIGEMVGDLKISKSGSGDVDVFGGNIDTLVVRKSGSGDVDVDADVIDADLRSSGSGDIDVRRVTGDLSQASSGSSDITVSSRD
jgi:hypothetical protein